MKRRPSHILIRNRAEKFLMIFFTSILMLSCNEKKSFNVPAPGSANAGEKPFLIELVIMADSLIDTDKMKKVVSRQELAADTIYRWKNHYVFYGASNNPQSLADSLQLEYPGSQVKMYDSAFYKFNRERCPEPSQSDQWKHIILTANLVEDTSLQREYLDHHAHQFDKWPEVSGGFCRAEFQELLLFKNGRQLMLVISIPKGKSLEELNPKTTENNPRVVDWNNLMKKYQEGIPGTLKNEVWVFMDPEILKSKN